MSKLRVAKNGTIISFEGGEGGGKTTQAERLSKRLEVSGNQVVVLREPGGTAISEQIREVVLSSKNAGIANTTEVLLFQAARAQVYQEVVIPSVQQGKVVLMDRTSDSSVVYQGVVRGLGKDLIEQFNQISTQNTYPNITFLLDIDVEVGLKRRAKTDKIDRLDAQSLKFHEQVRQAYLDLAREDIERSRLAGQTSRWIIIDASQALDDVESQIWQHLQSAFNRTGVNRTG
jgi:dTMP kinase